MRVALAILCIGAVTFLLRVLAGLVKEWMRISLSKAGVHLAEFNPHQRGGLIEMSPAGPQTIRPRTHERLAL
jgi:hypothetical protein